VTSTIKWLSILFFATLAQASQPWSTQDKLMEMGFATSIVMDWGQTRDIQRWSAGNHRHEENPILGGHPSNDAINNYFISSLVLHALIADQSVAWEMANRMAGRLDRPGTGNRPAERCAEVVVQAARDALTVQE